jgi:uncharacterized protein
MGQERRQALAQLCAQMGISLLYVFGSRTQEVCSWLDGGVGGLAPGPSDVDVGVRARAGVVWSVKQKVILAQALEDFFGCARVDLVVLDEAKPFLAYAIVRGERLFAHDSYAADEYDLYVLRRAGDLAPLERERLALLLGVSQ